MKFHFAEIGYAGASLQALFVVNEVFHAAEQFTVGACVDIFRSS
jgi:hypothetical protein